MTWQGIQQASLVWLFAFWRLHQIEQRRVKKKKADMLLQTMVGDCILPFMHWRMYCIDQNTASVMQTRHCFLLEKKMLAVEVTDLEEQRSDLRRKLEREVETTQRLVQSLADESRERHALAERLENA